MSILGCAFILLLAACGDKPQTTDSGNVPSSSHDEVNEEQGELAVTIVDETFASWQRGDTVWVSYSAELKNDNNVPVFIDRMRVEFLDEEGEVFQGVGLDPIPTIIMPNETAYVVDSVPTDNITDPAIVKGTTVEIDVFETDEERLMLETNNAQFELLYENENMPYKVTGIMTNPHDKTIENVQVTAGLYNDKGELVAVLKKMMETNLGTNNSEEFYTFYPELSDDIYGKVTEVKTKAYEDPR